MAEGPFIGRAAGAAALRLVALACALGVGALPGGARGEDLDPDVLAGARAREWGTSALMISFFDSFLGMPHTRLRDDNGFVANLSLTVELPHLDRERFRVGVSEQLITERGGPHRVDDGRVFVSWERFLGATPGHGLTIGGTAGLRVVGDLGGSVLQDWAHRTLFTGRRLDGQGGARLQSLYPPGYSVLGDLGARARIVHPVGGPWSVRVGVEAGLGVGTGWFGELHPFVAIALTTGPLEVELRQGAGIYGTSVRPLTMPGGYVTGVLESQPSIHASLLGPRSFPLTLSFDLEWNQGNSHQHVGGFTFGARF
jgi:hypothetical protein